MPSTTSSLGLEALGLLDRDDAFIADLLHRLGDICRSTLSPLAEIVPTWAISSFEVTFLELALRSRDHRLDGEVDAALEVHRVEAGGDGLGAFADDRRGEHGRGGGAVAGDVVRAWRRLRARSARR